MRFEIASRGIEYIWVDGCMIGLLIKSACVDGIRFVLRMDDCAHEFGSKLEAVVFLQHSQNLKKFV